MTTADTRGKLFAAFARRLDAIDDVQLEAAVVAWQRDRSRSLSDLLIARGAIGVKTRALVEEIVAVHLAAHGGDLEACYRAIADKGWVPAVLVADIPPPPPDDNSPPPTAAPNDPGAAAGVAGQVGADDVTETVTLGSYASGGSRYELVEFITRGGMGEVWLARDLELNRTVLLKQVLPKYAQNPESRANFLRETRTGANLEHPGIVPVYDIGQHPGGQLFQVMRYFRPGSLHKKIASYHLAHPESIDELAFRAILGHFATACRAIDYVHSRGIHHLDIKPQNIVTGDFGETQIIDWGLARVTDGDMLVKVTTESGRLGSGSSPGERSEEKPPAVEVMPRGLRGTPSYAAPEQWRGNAAAIGAHSDVYGLGATLFEILAGKAPFIHPSPTIQEDVEIGNVHREMRPWAPLPLRAICRKAMAVKPADRYASVGALADDIDRYLADEPVAAWPDPWHVRAWRFVKRHRTAVAAASALLATTAVALGVGNVLVARQRDRAVTAEREAIAQRDLAERNASMTREVIADFIGKVADDQWGTIPGTGVLRRDAVQGVVDKFPELLAQQPDNPDLRYDAALIYRRCANLYRVLGELATAAPLYERSRELIEKLASAHPSEERYTLGWIHHLLDEAEVILRSEGPLAATKPASEALEEAEKAVEVSPKSPGALWTLGRARMDRADLLVEAGDADAGATLAAGGVKNFAAAMALDGSDEEAIRFQTRLLASLGAVVAANAHREAGRPDEALSRLAERSSAELSEAHVDDPSVDYVRALALTEQARYLGLDAATAAEGEALLSDAIDRLRGLVAASPAEANFRPKLAEVLTERGAALLAGGTVTEAVELADEAIAAVAPLDRPDGAAEAKRSLARAHALRGRGAKAAGDEAAAKAHVQQAASFYEAAIEAAPDHAKLREEAAATGRLLAE